MASSGDRNTKIVGFIVGFGGLLLGLGACTVACVVIGGEGDHVTPTTSARSAIARTSPVPMPALDLQTAVGCQAAPSKLVGIINAAFTNGEHLGNAHAVDGPSGIAVVGGDIVAKDGSVVSSKDSWMMRGGTVYALSSDARRHTLLPDGRDGWDWSMYAEHVGACAQ